MLSPIAPSAPTLIARTESPTQVQADSVSVIDHYGVAPAAVAFSEVARIAANLSTDTVSPVAHVARTQPALDGVGEFVDRYA